MEAAKIMQTRKTHSSEFNTQPDPPAAVLGITRKQTARINIFNLHNPGTPPINVEFIFRDADGNVLVQSTQSVEGKKAAWFDLNAAGWSAAEPDRSAAEPHRRQIIGLIKLLSPPEPDGGAVAIVASVEVFDNVGVDAGKTRIYQGITNYPESASDQ
jgi:hypothetical protein